MFLALEFFLIGEFLARGDDLVLRLDMGGFRSGRLGIRLTRAAAAKTASDPADLQSRGKAFEVAFLLVGKVDCKSLDFHDVRRSSCGHERWRTKLGSPSRNRLGHGPSGFQKRSGQLRCCGNPSWT